MMLRSCLLLPILLLVACESRLTYDEAESVITGHPLIRRSEDAVKVEGISLESGKNEAIVRAAIAGHSVNLRFRRYDQGWAWEFVETASGGWVTPEKAIGEIREEQRRKRVAEWVAAHKELYARTLKAMDQYSDGLPHLLDRGLLEGWLETRKLFMRLAQLGNFTEAERRERIKAYSEPAIDAWGNEVLIHFDESQRVATFLSLGPDKTKGTPDDVMCVAQGVKEWSQEHEKVLWQYPKTWALPEGLEEVVAPYVGAENRGRVKYVTLIRP